MNDDNNDTQLTFRLHTQDPLHLVQVNQATVMIRKKVKQSKVTIIETRCLHKILSTMQLSIQGSCSTKAGPSDDIFIVFTNEHD